MNSETAEAGEVGGAQGASPASTSTRDSSPPAAVQEGLMRGSIKPHAIEQHLLVGGSQGQAHLQAVEMRRAYYEKKHTLDLATVPYQHFDYAQIYQKNCENPVGYVPIPVALLGPLKVNGKDRFMPLATTEGALAASTMRGIKALNDAGGVTSIATEVGMTRSPLIKLANVRQAAELKHWITQPENMKGICAAFQSTTNHGKLLDLHVLQNGRYLHIRHRADCGLANGMNMVSKGTEATMQYILDKFGKGRLLTLSGNTCTDKKANTVNTILGRSKHAVAEVFLNNSIITDVLHTTAEKLVECNVQKNLIGSGLAGAHAAGFNAHAGNLVAGMFLATGQDLAQITSSASCVTNVEECGSDEVERKDCVNMTVTLPCLEIACLSGGTGLQAQHGLMGLTGVLGEPEEERTLRLAEVMAAFVLAGELNLLSALTSNQLVSAHMKFNRAKL